MWFFVKLTLYFNNHLHSSKSNTLHGHSCKRKGYHTSQNQKSKCKWIKHVNTLLKQLISGGITNSGNKGTKQGKRYESSRSNGKTLSYSGGGITSSIKSICF